MNSSYKVAAVQMASGPNVSANLNEVGRLVESAVAAGARLVVLPENFALMPVTEDQRMEAAEEFGEGPIQAYISSLAAQYGIWIVAGTIGLIAPAAGKIRAASMLYDASGNCVARYDKIHLFDVQLENGESYAESTTFDAGVDTVVVETPFGMLGLAICYDLRFPELFRKMLDQGAEIFAVPSAFTATTGRAHWEVLVRARALENLAYLIAADQGGYHVSGRDTHGDSMIVGPWGDIIDRLPRGSGLVIGDIDRARLQAVRRSLPSIQHRKSHLR
jgi:nitrilase